MIIEHILFNLSIAIIVGLAYQHYTGRNPAWLIVAAVYLPDLDYIIQEIWYTFYELNGYLSPIQITHGDFHNILSIVVLTILFAWIYKKYLHGKFIDGIICIGIGGFVHLFEDIIVYDNTYHLFVPFNNVPFQTLNWIPETRNIMGIGDTHIIFIGICLLVFCLTVKFAIEGEDRFIHYLDQHIKPIPAICISIIVNTLKI
jgi:membrane-bound metal-dependent hydrolase YbcI (DUF457 family)